MEDFDRGQAVVKISNQLKDKIKEHGFAVMGVSNFATYSLGVSLKPETPFEFVVDTHSVQLGHWFLSSAKNINHYGISSHLSKSAVY